MERQTIARRVNSSHITVRNAAGIISCLLAFFPCLFSSLTVRIGSWGLIIIYVLAILFAMYSINSRMLVNVKGWQIRPFILWGVVLIICIFNNNGDIQHSSFSFILRFLFIIVFAILFVSQSESLIRNVLRVMALYLIIQIILGFYFLAYPDVLLRIGQQFFALDAASYSRFTRFVNNGAFMGLTSHYSTSGMYMSLAVVLSASCLLVYRNKSSRWNIWFLLAFIVSIAALVLTQKRAHLLFSIAAIILMYLIGYVKGNFNRRLTQVIVFIIIFVVAFLIAWQIPAFQRVILRFFSGDTLDEVSSHRVDQLWTPAIREFINHPFRGMGWRQFKYIHPMSNGVNNDVHNIYLQFFAENGIVMGIYIIVLIIWTYVSSWRLLLKMKSHEARNEYLFLMFAFGYQTFFILYGLTGNPFYDIQCLFPFMLSCGITYMCMAKYRSDLKFNRVWRFIIRR